MTREPVISIITPTRNRRAALARAMASVQAQSLTDYEHIIIDDASTDGTAELVEGLDDPRIRFERFETWQGGNRARNRGVALARAPLVTFLDSDDEFLPHRLEHCVRKLDADPNVQVLLSSRHTADEKGLTLSQNPGVVLTRRQFEHSLMAFSIFIATSGITIRREALVQCGGFAPGLRRMQDREMLLRISRRHGVRLLAEVDWIKHASRDSISSQSKGSIEAFGALLELHPELLKRYPELVRYHVARRILSDFRGGRLRTAAEAYRANRRLPHLRFSPRQLFAGYLQGKSARRRWPIARRSHRLTCGNGRSLGRGWLARNARSTL